MGKTKIFSLLLVTVMILSSLSVNVQAENYNNNGRFNDVDEDHWAYKYIEMMSEYQIINGYGDGTFGPDDSVSREQFAKMLVLTLQLDTYKPSSPYFSDVNKSEWSYEYVETARPYLTGYVFGGENYFYPSNNAEREDMAVAIVLAMGLSVDDADLDVLDDFDDEDNISKNLRPYVAVAVEEGIMIGDGENFNPRSSLERAEAATLLARLIEGEKVVFDSEKVVYADDDGEVTITSSNTSNRTTTLTVDVKDDKINLNWTEVNSSGFRYYKVVASMDEPTPIYPGDGYMQAISNEEKTSTSIKPYDKINNGDTSKLMPGEKYYLSITTVYEKDERYASNVIPVTVPEVEEDEVPSASSLTPVLTGVVEDDGISLDWTTTSSDGFVYYKVVFSENDSTPIYPGDGYLTYINDVNDSDYYAKEDQNYHGGDIGGELESDETYYISITAVYKFNGDLQYIPSNTIKLVMPD